MEIFNCPIKEIKIEERQRKKILDVSGLQFSIEQYGLLHPIVLEKLEEGQGYELIAGERRLTACTGLGFTHIPAVLREDLDEIFKKELELEENVQRESLNWRDKAEAISEILELKRRLNRNAIPEKFGKQYTQKDLAKELGVSEATISQDILLAEGVKKYPEQLKNIQTRREAIRQLRRLETGGIREDTEAIKRIKENIVYDSFSRAMGKIEDHCVDLLIADITTNVERSILEEFHRVLAIAGNMFLFYPFEKQGQLIDMLQSLKFIHDPKPYIWHVKGEDTYETFIWISRAVREAPKHVSKHNSHRRDKVIIHEYQKPYQLYYNLISNTTLKGAYVLNPLCYDPNIIKAGYDLRRNVKGIVVNKNLYDQILFSFDRRDK